MKCTCLVRSGYAQVGTDDGAGAVGGHAVVREQGVQERAEHAALTAQWC